MENAKQYFEKTKLNPPRPLTKKFIEMNINPQKAVELGCGAGNDTAYLIKNGWDVIAIDVEDTEQMILEKLNSKEKIKFEFSKQNFENIDLYETNLILANYSIPFCKKDNFKEFWKKIEKNIIKDGYFVGNFFGVKDSWKDIKKDNVFLSKEEVLKLFEKNFEIILFEEIENDKQTANGNMKHWHIFNVIARKK